MELSEEAKDYWADRRAEQEFAVMVSRAHIEAMGLEPVRIERRVQGELVLEGVEPVSAEPELPLTERVEWEGPLPRSANTIVKKARDVGYAWAAYHHHGERRGAHGRLLDPPSADVCSLAIARGHERAVIIWEEVKGKWKFSTALDFTRIDNTTITPRVVNLATIKKERLQ